MQMATIKQSLAWWCFHRGGMTPERFFSEAARIGYAAVELLGEDLWPVARDHGLVIASAGGHKSLTDGLNRREAHDRIETEINASLEKAVRFGIPNLIVFSGNRGGLDDETGIENTAAGLRRVAKAAEDAGVNLVLELLNSKVNHKDYQCDRTAWGVKVCETVGSPRVKLLYDIYHMQIMEGDLIRTIREHHAHFGHYHTAGNPGRNEMDETQEIYYPPIIRAIQETGYEGYVGHEFIPKGDPIAAIEAAYALCDV
jgi:hydroxypyruvate isomerase